ncbi:MAG: phosphomannomutase/phosphoglucomutase [Candidatus Nealsonbacteria bacterium CG10_big_fil_rev_8_21_14_0_10_36_24]|uniref:Phosphomannomutase/phosphoglucomutase n=2 Tax=Candidatus Nealsoniibacteriota TaxID=1817911 RepID=A0A2H0YNN4_9BACT|nr:MAG: phosphomannomutase/phosphoglucomutase [Candidatus Nealsonbacteria bacterium CG10_big_fil_rev_8_21_14_0_10_36_24]PIS39879.1 MAG: phosphomannomutase/phosphoglucomutase [Candidatus Nealsonbacteria bacterium CG08_land_8_20_14_0_20_36_22]
MIVKSIFKSYDIRGIYPKELNKEAAYKIGRAFIEHTKAKTVAVGQDMRFSSPALFKSLTEGITIQGADVYNIGQVPTECLYFTVGHYGYDGGIMITASHNPKEYNGFKTVKKEGDVVNVIRGKDMIEIVEKSNFSKSGKNGEIKEIDIWQDYLNHIFSFVEIDKIKSFKVVIDAGNGMAGKTIPQIAQKLPLKIIPLNFKLDGNFPNHPSNPLFEGATDQISNGVIKKKSDFGFIFDGDADRIFLIDEKGNFVRADITLLLLAKYFLEKNPGKGVAYNLICSKSVPEFIKKWGGNPIRTQVGFLNIQKGILKNNGIMGGELSGHYCFKDNFYSDSGMIAFLTLLQIISASGKKVSELTKELSPYAKSAEINFKVKNKETILKKIREQFSDGKQDYLDGVTVEYKDWWFNIRPSQTEPLLRLTIEAENQEILEKKKRELITFF